MLAVFILAAQVATAQPQHYDYPNGRLEPGDHLLPAEALTDLPNGLAFERSLTAQLLGVPISRDDGDDDLQVHSWSVIFPSFEVDAGYSLARDAQGRWSVRGSHLEWTDRNLTPDLPSERPSELNEAWIDSLAQHVVGTSIVRRCQAPVEPALGVRFTDEINKRLVLARPGLIAMEQAKLNTVTADGTGYWFGGAAFGRTTNGRQGPDIDTMREAADAMIDYCFEGGPAALGRLSDAVKAMEDSEPN